jgi:chromosome segregation ATPase
VSAQKPTSQPPEFETQLSELNQTSEKIRGLLAFVESQKKNLEQSKEVIDKLNTERAKLQPLVNADRQVVEALFAAQTEKQNTSLWRERWIGFGLGVASSILASIVCAVAGIWLSKIWGKKPTTTEPEVAV